MNIFTFSGLKKPDTLNRGTQPSAPACLGKVAAAHRESQPPNESCSRISAARGFLMYKPLGTRSPARRKLKQTHFLISMTTVIGYLLGLGEPGCAGMRSLGAERGELLLQSPGAGRWGRMDAASPARPKTPAGEPGREGRGMVKLGCTAWEGRGMVMHPGCGCLSPWQPKELHPCLFPLREVL